MNKMTTLALLATLGFAAPAFAQTPANLHSDQAFSATYAEPMEMAKPAPAKDAKAAKPAKHSAAKHHAKAAKKEAKKDMKKDAKKDVKKDMKKDAKKDESEAK